MARQKTKSRAGAATATRSKRGGKQKAKAAAPAKKTKKKTSRKAAAAVPPGGAEDEPLVTHGANGAQRAPARSRRAASAPVEATEEVETYSALVDEAPRRGRAAKATPSGLRALAGSERSGKYVYCIVATSEPLRFGHIGIGAEPAEVHTINYKDIAAVVSDTPIEVYDPTRDNVLAHERVNELVMRENTVIPMAFGTVFKTREDILELLRSAYQAFRDVLVKMQGKLEFGLKVLWDPEAVIREVERDDESIRRLKKDISSQRGSTYFARMQYGRLVDAQLQERSERYVSQIFTALREVSVASRNNKPIGDRMIMNAAFLVPREQEGAFDAKVKEIGAQLDHLTFRYTGPWPPYNFVNIRLKLERAKN